MPWRPCVAPGVSSATKMSLEGVLAGIFALVFATNSASATAAFAGGVVVARAIVRSLIFVRARKARNRASVNSTGLGCLRRLCVGWETRGCYRLNDAVRGEGLDAFMSLSLSESRVTAFPARRSFRNHAYVRFSASMFCAARPPPGWRFSLTDSSLSRMAAIHPGAAFAHRLIFASGTPAAFAAFSQVDVGRKCRLSNPALRSIKTICSLSFTDRLSRRFFVAKASNLLRITRWKTKLLVF